MALAVATVFGVHLGSLAPVMTETSDIRLGLVGSIVSVAQGEAFPFKVLATNSGPNSLSIDVVIVLSSPSSETQKVRQWIVTVPGGTRATQQFDEVASQWFEETGAFRLSAYLEGVPKGNILSYTVTPTTFTVPVFADVTDAMGLSTVLESDLNRNHSAGAGWLEVRLARTTSNRDACGARAVLTSGPSAQARWVVCGSSLGTGTNTVLHFGGLPVESFRLDIDWPSGRHQTVLDGGLDRLMTVTEG